MSIHLFKCDKGIEDNKNILMDFPTEKYPGNRVLYLIAISVDIII